MKTGFDKNTDPGCAGIRLYVEKDYAGMSERAAALFAEALTDKPDGVFGFATGGTPVGMYTRLVKRHQTDQLDFSRAAAFNLDEYHPVRRDDPQSYYDFMQKNLFALVNIDPARTHIPDGGTDDPERECTAYEDKITAAGGIDLQILGIGSNGHIGFNEPAETFSARTAYITLAEATVRSNARFFASEGDVPKHAVTMGIRTIMMSRRILLLASGEGKAAILRETLRGPITPRVPASVLQLHRDVTVVADEAAASLL